MRYNEQIQLKLYTYSNSSFIRQAIIDDYQEISFDHNLYEAGDFTITINYNIPNALKFERGMFVQFGNDPYMFGEIQTITDSIGEDGKGSQTRTIIGKDARYIFKRRVIKNLNNEENWAMTGAGETCLRELIKAQCGSAAETKRQLPVTNIIPEPSAALGKEYSVAEAFSNLYDTLVTIATQSEIGWRIKFDGTLTLEVFEGADLSSQVQFSTDYDSLSNGEFTDSAESYSNTVYVAGKGTGSDRDIYEGEKEIEGASPAGLDRYESYDNQSQMTSESEYEAEALSMLTQYGQTLNVSGQGLAKCPYIFKEQYDIGDTITLAFSGKSAKVQILSVTENWTWGQYGISFSFGKPQNDLSRQLQLILKQIQKASNKTTTTSSVKYYTIPTDTQMPKADVIYDTIGFTGACANDGSTFQLYYDLEKTGAKTYHVYFKQLGGGKLTLTTGVSGASNLVLNSGTYVAIIYVDQEGNVTSQGATATSIIASGNTQPVTSDAVANNKTNSVSSGSDVPVTSGAVFDHSPRGSAYCSTSASTAAKVASMQDYVLQSGATFLITFKNSNSAASALTLKINDTAAKTLYINGSVSSADNYTLNAGTYICRYNGTNYYIDRSYAVPNARSASTATTANRSYSLAVAVTCSTAAATAAKTVSLSGFSLVNGARLIVNVSNANTATGPLTLSVNSTTAKTIKVNGRVTSSSFNTLAAGYYNCYYDGTYWCMTDVKSEVTNSVSASNTIAYCSTGASTVAKTATLYGYTLRGGDRILLYMRNTNTANTPTLNVNSTGAKPIRINGTTAVSATYKGLPKGFYMAFYDETYWNLYNILNLDTSTSFNGSSTAVTLDTDYGALGVKAWYMSSDGGYIKFANGLLIQWGKVASSSAVPATTTFSPGFFISYTQIPVVLLKSQTTIDTSSNNMPVPYGYAYFGGIGSISKTGFTCRCTNGNWFAIGY